MAVERITVSWAGNVLGINPGGTTGPAIEYRINSPAEEGPYRVNIVTIEPSWLRLS